MKPERSVRVGVLLSGRGSNLTALVEAASGYEVACVASDKPDAPGIAWSRTRGLATFAHHPREVGGKAAFEDRVDAFLREHGVEVVALAGYMRLLSPAFVARSRGRILNIHPSLLPAYKGLDTHARAIAAGEAEAGCSVHLVSEALDAGAVLGRARVPVLPGDTPDALAARVLAEEHRLYPRILSEYCRAMTTSPDSANVEHVRQVALQLPGAEEAVDGGAATFAVAGQTFAELRDGAALRVRGDGGWEEVDLAGDVDWAWVEDRVARGWELVAPAGLLEAGGR